MIGVPGGDAVAALLDAALVTEDQVADAVAQGDVDGRAPLQVLVDTGAVSPADVVRTAAAAVGLPYVELANYSVDPTAAARLPADYARRYGVLPLGWEDGELLVAVGVKQAGNIELKDDLVRLTRSLVRFALAPNADIVARIDQLYRAEDELTDLTSNITDQESADTDLSNFTAVAEEAPIVRFVNLLISQAITDRASDIHLEPTEYDLRVRYRIDGVLHESHRSPKSIQSGVISRLKIMADINIAERRVPQDGRLSVNHQGRKVDLRIATLPTVWGEKIVARILDNSTAQLGLDDLGFSDGNFRRYRDAYVKPYGMILVTGPTGSGKSTTLYATLNILNSPAVNIITVEDPVEYRLAGVNQVQTNPKAGLTFARALRSILRADPDVILIGEIRDHETAQIAVESALTGHMVLTTLHTNDAPSAISRLIEMGIEPFLVGSALDTVLAQRLCRTLCESCKQAYTPTEQELVEVRFGYDPSEPLPVLYRGVGCAACARTGYYGRMALHEVMTVTEEIERLAVARASTDEIEKMATAQGMTSLREDGWLKVRKGLTSIEEILRVVA
ncbi:GspE/PulE family protein [Sporichthya sp.]|uniref:GspE/PulE family protein n=1 Tax=Sporichthya sp. TaxID=65475 RepID=UPI00182742DA|nr:GspE/PulE family protein [Sporichthya sp.]MBA3742100.1 type II/IV secretion system protein [Sporichthya sp.]